MLEMTRGKVSGLAIAMVATMLVLSVAPFARAQGVGSAGTSVSPPITDVTANPGEAITRSLEISNNGNASQTYSFVVANLSASGEEGESAYTGIESGGIASWTTLSPSSVTLGAGESVDLSVKIAVPSNAPAGGHYATVFAKTEGAVAAEGTGSAVSTMVGANILLRVTGTVIENAKIDSFAIGDASFDVGDTADFQIRVSNLGNTHVSPAGYIELFRDGKRVSQVAVNETGANVLPNSTRRFEVSSDALYLPGTYSAKVTLAYAGGKVLTTSDDISFVVRGEYSVLVLVSIVLAVLVGALALTLLVKRKKVRV